jgi:hypothetical protein
MHLLTTESQSHRENEKDQRTAPIIGAAIEVHRHLGPVCSNQHTTSAYVTNSIFATSRFSANSICRSRIKESNSIAATKSI